MAPVWSAVAVLRIASLLAGSQRVLREIYDFSAQMSARAEFRAARALNSVFYAAAARYKCRAARIPGRRR